jgi:hypothetical protein
MVMSSRHLNEIELEAYDVVPEAIGRRVRIHRIRLIPGGYAGMTLGRRVLLARDVDDDGTSALLAHELVHARQWAEQGRIRFAWRYLTSFARNLARHRRWKAAYNDIEAELEAKRETTDWLRRRARDAAGQESPDGPTGESDQ